MLPNLQPEGNGASYRHKPMNESTYFHATKQIKSAWPVELNSSSFLCYSSKMRTPLHIAFLFVAGLFLTAVPAWSQSWILRGQIEEAGTHDPIPFANISIKGTQQGGVSNEAGVYRLDVEGDEVILEVSRMGYRRKAIRVKRKRAVQSQNIVLEVSDVQIDDVVISDGLQRVFEDPTLHLYDYEFYGDQLLVIVYDRKQKRSRLALVNDQDSIISITDGEEEPGKFFKDCLGNVHVLGKRYACQVWVMDGQSDSDRIGWFRDSLETFYRVVKPCLASLDEYRYYKFGQGNDQLMHYVAYNAETKEQRSFVQIKDKVKIHQMLDPLGQYAGFARTEAQLLAIPPEIWDKINKLDHNYQFERLAFFYPISAPLHVIDEEVCLFDHTNGLLHRLAKDGSALPDQEVAQTEIPITYHKESNWQRVIYSDPIRGEAYATYLKNGMVTLKEIDLETGELKGSYELPRQFPTRVQVRDGVVYFLYKELDYDTTNRLYRLRIKD